jgi:hypothetical protein
MCRRRLVSTKSWNDKPYRGYSLPFCIMRFWKAQNEGPQNSCKEDRIIVGKPDFDFCFSLWKSYDCIAETIALVLEDRYEDYAAGKEIRLWRADEIGAIAQRHGFKLSGFKGFEHAVTKEHFKKQSHGQGFHDSGQQLRQEL